MTAIGIVLQWWALYLFIEVALEFSYSVRRFRFAWSDPAAALTLAIFGHFIAGVVDGTYWQGAWSAQYHQHWAEEFLFKYGIVANIPFRHILPILVAFLHLRSVTLQRGECMTKYYIRSALVLSLGIFEVLAIN